MIRAIRAWWFWRQDDKRLARLAAERGWFRLMK